MVSSIQSYDSTQQTGGTQGWSTQTLTDKQESTIDSILSKYDSSDLSSSDAQSIMDALRKAGIPMGSGLKDEMKADGYDLKQVAKLARQAQQQDGSSSSSSASSTSSSSTSASSGGIDVSALQSLQSILSQYDLSNLTSDQENDLTSQLQQSGLLQSGNIIDLSA
jgi:hypothetical protein